MNDLNCGVCPINLAELLDTTARYIEPGLISRVSAYAPADRGSMYHMTDAEFSNDKATAQRAENVIEQLVSALDLMSAKGSVKVVHGSGKVFAAAYGWWALITRSSQAILALRRVGLEQEASPIMRTILQHVLVLQWLVDTGDSAVDAVEEYGDDNTRLLLKTMHDADWPAVPGLNLNAPPRPATPSPLVTKLKNFEELCVAYNALQLYVAFRLMSTYVHPTSVGSRAYFDETSGQLAACATGTAEGSRIIQTAMCLIQAGKVINQLLEGDPLTEALAKAEAELGIQMALWTPRQPKGT